MVTAPGARRVVVTSTGGGKIAVDSRGSGPDLVIVSGAGMPPRSYAKLVAALEADFTVHYYHRRGRGDSTAQLDPYEMAQEIDDLEAVLGATRSTLAFGHSYGGLITLRAAMLPSTTLTRFAVYDPAASIDHGQPTAYLRDLEAALHKGRHARALDIVLEQISSSGPLRRMPAPVRRLLFGALLRTVAKGMRSTLPTVPIEAREATGPLDAAADTYGVIRVPGVIMIGERSMPWVRSAASAIAAAIPSVDFGELAGLDHGAPLRAPTDIAEAIRHTFIDADPLLAG
jgi:pimeloyl-ACP methyl ester carboxylesterase